MGLGPPVAPPTSAPLQRTVSQGGRGAPRHESTDGGLQWKVAREMTDGWIGADNAHPRDVTLGHAAKTTLKLGAYYTAKTLAVMKMRAMAMQRAAAIGEELEMEALAVPLLA